MLHHCSENARFRVQYRRPERIPAIFLELTALTRSAHELSLAAGYSRKTGLPNPVAVTIILIFNVFSQSSLLLYRDSGQKTLT
jgi:hypothetical protein